MTTPNQYYSPNQIKRSNSLSSYKQKRAKSKNKNLDIQKLQQTVYDLENNFIKMSIANSQKNINSHSTQNINHSFNDSINLTKQEPNNGDLENPIMFDSPNVSIAKKIQQKYNNFNENIVEVEDDGQNLQHGKISYNSPDLKKMAINQKHNDKLISLKKVPATSKFLLKKNGGVVTKKLVSEKSIIIQKTNNCQCQILKYLGNDKKKEQQKILVLFSQIINLINQK